jgi:hypothetical protein
MRNAPTRVTFSLRDLDCDVANVLDESRTLAIRGQMFEDEFEPYGVHLYRLGAQQANLSQSSNAPVRLLK